MQNISKFFFILIFILSYNCSHKTLSPLEVVYKLAGSNSGELKRVIRHYSSDTADSLKLKAAEFLILNMVDKYSEYYDAPWQDVATLNMRWSSSSDKNKVLNTFEVGNIVRKDDVTHMKADYLISNIELAFQVWNDKPWGQYIPFDTFCEEILPYRIGTEPLENWREKVLASFADVDNMLKEDSTLTAVQACSKVNSILPRFRMDKDFSNMSYTQLMATTRGQCDSQAALAAFVMRALGIPVTIDFTPQWKSYATGHDWNSVSDSTGQHISFLGTEVNPHDSHQGNTFQKAKAYRNTFKINKVTNADEVSAPSPFYRNLYDISSEHKDMVNASLPINDKLRREGEDIFLSLFYDFEWRITGHADVDADSIHFGYVGKGILYLPVYYLDNNQTPAGPPFFVDNKGEMHVFYADDIDSVISFKSINPGNDLHYNNRMINSVFEVSDDADFSESFIVHTISDLPKLYNSITLPKEYNFQYIRYRDPDNGCNASEISFYDADGNKLEGEYIGLSGSYDNLGDTGDKVFDNDVTTYYDALELENSWAGLDFGEKKKIASIRYSPRLLGIGIYDGHEYELFCMSGTGWNSVDAKVADGDEISFNAPKNGLLYILNKTTGKRGQPFYMIGENIYYYYN